MLAALERNSRSFPRSHRSDPKQAGADAYIICMFPYRVEANGLGMGKYEVGCS